MATLADALISSTSRPLSLRMRPDLSARRQRYHGRTYWVVKEPVGLNYFRFHEEEYAILCMLDGHTSMEEIKNEFEQEFTPQKITFQDLQQFIGMLHRSGLVISHATGQGHQLRKRRDQKKRRELIGKFSNVFALRWRGIDPDKLLDRIYPYTGWFFAPVMVICVLLLALAALALITVQFEVFQSRLPSFNEFFFGYKNWLYLMIMMGVAKVLHEFGHGLTCKRFGGECHEMGFMLLVFTPALYCNVSDSWMLPNKWHRVFIGAGGMYVEIFLASIATFVWWFSDPATLLNQLALRLVFICSVSTILFNGNPLLRFDGYYILMDIIEIPNLRQKATEVLKRFLVTTCLGIEQQENPFLPQEHRFWFGMYTIAAVIYRWIVVLSILLFLNKVLEPYGLKVIGRLLGAVGLFGLVVQPLFKLGKFFYVPGRMHKVKRHRLIATAAVVAAVILIVIFLPLPYHVSCSFDIKPRDARTVYASVPGRLVEAQVEPGDEVVGPTYDAEGNLVSPGTILAKLDNVELEMQVIDLESRIEELRAELKGLWVEAHYRESAGRRIPEVREQIRTYEKQRDEKRLELAKLQITAPASGIVIPVADRKGEPQDDSQLNEWAGTPLQKKNRGAYLVASDAICQIGDPQELVAELVIDQKHIDLVRKDHKVEMMLDSYSGVVLKGQVEKISLPNMQSAPASLSTMAGGDVNTQSDKQGRLKPISTSYPALVGIPENELKLQVGLRGRAKIYTGWQPLGRRLYRVLARTFHFEL